MQRVELRSAMNARDSDWVVPCTILVTAQHVAGFIVSRFLNFAPAPPTRAYMTIAAVLTVFALTAALLRELWRMARAGEAQPARSLRRKIAAHWSDLLLYAIGFQLVALQIAALTWLKEMLPLVVPFWADPLLSRMDFALFAGDPSRFLRWAVPAIEPVYIGWAIVKFATLIILLSLPPSELKRRCMLAYFLTVGVAAVCGQFLISSAGPLFYQHLGYGDAYAPLIADLRNSAPTTLGMADYLWSTYSAGATKIGTGISAMPSLHVAVAFWIFLVVRELAPKLRWVGLAYWLVIFMGSFALGWHYVSDAVVGSLAAWGAWKAAAVMRLPSRWTALQPAFRRG
jgi:hypothetical protein